jgi:hypothetical protein
VSGRIVSPPCARAAGLALALACALAGTASAQGHTLAILAVEASSTDLARSLEGELEARLGAMRLQLVPRAGLRARMRDSTKWTEGCLVGGCLSEVRVQTGARLVLLAALTGSGTTFGYVVTVVRTDTGRVMAQEAERCDVCTASEATTRAVAAAVKLVREIPGSLPDDAAEQGAAVEVAVNAVNRERAAERRAARRGVRRVGWTLTLVGVAAAAAGTALYLAGDDRPALGLAAAAAGGGLAAGGIAILAF